MKEQEKTALSGRVGKFSFTQKAIGQKMPSLKFPQRQQKEKYIIFSNTSIKRYFYLYEEVKMTEHSAGKLLSFCTKTTENKWDLTKTQVNEIF